MKLKNCKELKLETKEDNLRVLSLELEMTDRSPSYAFF